MRTSDPMPPNKWLQPRMPSAALVGLSLLVAGSAAGQPFTPSCTIPFDLCLQQSQILRTQ
jgi:hypothetical protein